MFSYTISERTTSSLFSDPEVIPKPKPSLSVMEEEPMEEEDGYNSDISDSYDLPEMSSDVIWHVPDPFSANNPVPAHIKRARLFEYVGPLETRLPVIELDVIEEGGSDEDTSDEVEDSLSDSRSDSASRVDLKFDDDGMEVEDVGMDSEESESPRIPSHGPWDDLRRVYNDLADNEERRNELSTQLDH